MDRKFIPAIPRDIPWLVLALCMAASFWTPAKAYVRRPNSIIGRSQPEQWMSTPELISFAGYKGEVHEAWTEDGYMVKLHRILPRGSNGTKLHGTPLLVGHGMASSSEQWVVRHDAGSMVYRLVDAGFDVWLTNYRGCVYARKHSTLSTKSHKFWDFSWHENGVFDQPAMIDYVLARTGRASLLTVGHSMSSTALVVMLAERPEYAKKVRAVMLLAPPVFFTNPSGVIAVISALVRSLGRKFQISLAQQIINNRVAGTDIPGQKVCGPRGLAENAPLPVQCATLLELSMGRCSEPQNYILYKKMMTHFPAGASIRQLIHYGNSVYGDGGFRKYDFGPERNRQLYGASDPPAYNLSSITSPVYIYYGPTDNLVNYKDAELLGLRIPSTKRMYKVPSTYFNHIDFMLGESGIDEVFSQLIEDLNKYV